jgi:hypothetical protein
VRNESLDFLGFLHSPFFIPGSALFEGLSAMTTLCPTHQR